MHPRLIDAKAPGCPWPKCDITTGRRDGDLVHFGELAPVVTAAPARDAAVLVKTTKVEWVASTKLGMVSRRRHEAALEKIARLEAELRPLREMSATVARLREALDPAPEGDQR